MPVLRDAALPRLDPWGEETNGKDGPVGHRPAQSRRFYAWLVPGLLMAILGAIQINRAGLWDDELATWGMTSVSWSENLKIFKFVDAVIAPYYGLMHVWTSVAGDSDLALRLPSAVAMALAAALIGATASRSSGPQVGLLSGLVFAVLPSSSRFAQEARPYALTLLAAALSTYCLVRILNRPRFIWFLVYTLAVVALGLLHFVALLLLVGHGWIILARRRRLVWAWAGAALVGVAPVLPLVWIGNQQKGQVSWIGQAYQSYSLYFDTIFGTIVIAAVIGVLALFSMPLRYPSSVYLAWAVLPVLALLAASQVSPLFLPRYLLFTLPAWALLAGATLARVPKVFAVVGVLAIAALGIPTQLQIRTPAGHDSATLELAGLIEQQFQPGDGVVYSANDAQTASGWVARDTLAHYVDNRHRPTDVFAKRPQRTDGQLLALECDDLDVCLGTTPRVWVIRMGNQSDPLRALGDGKEDLLRSRYNQKQVWRPTSFTVALLVHK